MILILLAASGPVSAKLLAVYVWFLLAAASAADRPGRDCQFQLAAGCLA